MGRLCAGFLLLSLCAPATQARENVARIHDEAKLFSPYAIARAIDTILEWQQTTNFDFQLETTKTLPEEVVARLNRAGNAQRAFSEYAEELARAADVQGVFVLISTMSNHSYIGVIVRPEEYQSSFSDHQREQLRKLLAGKLKKHPDEALLKAVEMVRDTVRASRKQAASWFGWGTVAALIGGLLGLWLVLGLLRMWMHAGQTPARPSYSEGPGRPGFVPGLLGGMFGSVAGLWIYDKFFEAPPSASVPSSRPQDQLPG